MIRVNMTMIVSISSSVSKVYKYLVYAWLNPGTD